ncbi:MAG: hypothetical protein ACOC36_00610 [Fibrobacterota bacterium]
MSQTRQDSICLFLSLACIAFCIKMVSEIPTAFFRPESSSATAESPDYDASRKVQAALNAIISSPPITFRSDFESPFRPYKLKPVRVSAPPRPPKIKTTRKHFRLKGLMQSSPLAIIEDSNGRTFIKGQGEKIHNTEIVSINPTSVVLKDSLGTFELTVEETR